MDDAYVIGIRLALENGVSEGVAAIRGELAALDRAVAHSALQLEALRRAAATLLQPASPAALGVPAERPKPVQPKPALADEPSTAVRSELSVVVAPPVTPRLDAVAQSVGMAAPAPAPRTEADPARAERAVAEVPPTRVDAPRVAPIAPPMAPPAAPPTRVASPEAAGRAPGAAVEALPPAVASPAIAPVATPATPAAPAASAPVMAPPLVAAPMVSTANARNFAAVGRQAIALPQADVAMPVVPAPVEADPAPAPARGAVPAPNRDAVSQRPARLAAPVQAGFSAEDRVAATRLVEPVSRPGRSTAPPAALPADQRKAAGPQVPLAHGPGLAPAAAPGVAAALPSAVPPPDVGGSGRISGDVYLDGSRVGRWLESRMEREVGRPPAGPTFFDPRQSPAWGGATVGM